MKPKRIGIGTPTASVPVPEEEEEIFPDDISLALPVVDVPLANLCEEEQLDGLEGVYRYCAGRTSSPCGQLHFRPTE